MKHNFLLIALVSIFLLGCSPKVKLPANYFANQKKVGIVYDIQPIGIYKEGPQGILDQAVTPGKKYVEPLEIVDEEINPKTAIQSMFHNRFTQAGKSIKNISEEYFYKSFDKFSIPQTSGVIYEKYDLRSFKEHGIDELVIVEVQYGLLLTYYGFIQTGMFGTCHMKTKIVDLHNNSILYRNVSKGKQVVPTTWNSPPKYERLARSVKAAIAQTMIETKEKLQD